MSSGVFMADDLTCAVAATGLVGAARQFPSEPLGDVRWRALLAQTKFHKMQGLLAAAVRSGALPATPSQHDEVLSAHAAAMELCLQLESDLLDLVEPFERVGVELRVLKGPSFAHLDYSDPSQRSFGDLDLLVRSEQYEMAVGALADGGYRRAFDELRSGFDRRFGKGANFTGPDGQRAIDVHRTFVMGPFGLALRLGDLWSTAETFRIAGRSFMALDADQRFLHACFHAAIGNARTRLVPLRDLAGMLQREHRPVDLPRVRALSTSWQSDIVLARAVTLAWDAFGLDDTELSRWAAARAPTAVEERSLRTYLDPDMGYAARCYAALAMIRGPREKAAFVRALAFPDRHYGAGRHTGRWRRWRNAARQISRLYGRRSRRP